MAARLERKHYERAAVYAARGEWRKCASHVARAVAFGSMQALTDIDDEARSATFRRVEKGSRECVPTKTKGKESRTACAFRQCEAHKCETDFTQCYVVKVLRDGKAPVYKCRGRYGKTKNEPEERRTCTYSVAHGKCKLDQSRDNAFEKEGACTYQDGKCETNISKAIRLAEEYFNRKGAKRAEEDAESAEPEPLRGEEPEDTHERTRSPRLSPAKDNDAQIAKQGRRGAEHEEATENSAAPKISRALLELAGHNKLGFEEERPLGRTRSHHKSAK
jgi:hypothetical protein